MNILKIALTCICFTNSILATEITVATYNIDTDINRNENGFARDTHPLWRANERIGAIQQTIGIINTRHHPDIWLFQEGRIFTTIFGDRVDSMTSMCQYLKNCGYNVVNSFYHPLEKDASYISAFNQERFDFIGTQIRYFSKTPDQLMSYPSELGISIEGDEFLTEIKTNNFGERWERSAFMMHLLDKLTGHHLCVINVHFDISYLPRIESSKLLNVFTKDILEENPSAKIIIGGDFNSFPDWGGADMMNVIEEGGLLRDATKNVTLYSNSEPYDSTIFMFPYDFGPKDNEFSKNGCLAGLEKMDPRTRREAIKKLYANECQARGGHLDHLMFHGFSSAFATVNPVPLFPDDAPIKYSEEEVRSYVLKHYDDGPAFASDHQPVIATFKY